MNVATKQFINLKFFKMKKIVSFFTLVILISSCSKENESVDLEAVVETQSLLIQKYLEFDTKKNQDYSFKELNINNDISEFGFDQSVTELVEISENQKFIGYLLRNGEKFYQVKYLDESLETFDLIDMDDKNQYSFERQYSPELDFKVVYPSGYFFNGEKSNPGHQNAAMDQCDVIFALQVTACVTASLAIAASDGPAPFMDILAASTYITCNAAAAAAHTKCKEDQAD